MNPRRLQTRWKRVARLLIGALLAVSLGATTTVGVAWALAALVDVRRSTELRAVDLIRDPDTGGRWLLVLKRFRPFGAEVFMSPFVLRDQHGDMVRPDGELLPAHIIEGWAREVVSPRLAALPVRHEQGVDGLLVEAWGWPRLAFWCEYDHWQARRGVISGAAMGAIEVPGVTRHKPGRSDPYPLALPYRPIWSSVLSNTAVFGSAWWLFLALPGLSRRTLRRWRGHCPTCGYDLAGLAAGAPCPECGRSDQVTADA